MFACKNVFHRQTKAENMRAVSLKVNYHSLFRCQKMRKGAQLVKLTSIKVVLFLKKSCQLSDEDMLFIEPFFKGSFIQENLPKISLLENVIIF